MRHTYDIACGGAPCRNESALALNVSRSQGRRNVNLKIEDISRPILRVAPSHFQDLIEIATYVYCADQAFARTERNHLDVDTFNDKWNRAFRFHIPVRTPAFWNRPDVRDTLTKTLNFLSDDDYDFTFSQAAAPNPFESYLSFAKEHLPGYDCDQVILFSGGLDSLAGVVQEVIAGKSRAILVTHTSTFKNEGHLNALRPMIAERSSPFQPLHVGITANKARQLTNDSTQRTRSFLFASFGATVAQMVGLKRFRFFENGVVSLNLPICAQVVGGRATRTTHPQVLQGFQDLFSLLSEEVFIVENGFLDKTKADVVRIITQADCGAMIAKSISCAHTRGRSSEHPHCGTCSQCIDRRFGIVAAGAIDLDPADQYAIDVFTGALPKGLDRIMAASFLERAQCVSKLKDSAAFIAAFPEVLRAIQHVPGPAMPAAERMFHLYKKHATEVLDAMETMLCLHSRAIARRTLHPDCLLQMILPPGPVRDVAVTTEAPAIEPPSVPNRLVWGGDRWDFAFCSTDPVYLDDSDGIAYIAFLLSRPGEAFSHIELYRWLKPEEDPQAADAFFRVSRVSGPQVADEELIATLNTRKKGIGIEMDDARSDGNFSRLEELEEELDKVEKELRRCVTSKGHIRKERGSLEGIRTNVVKAIGRVRRKIKKANPSLGIHLDQLGPDRNEPGHLIYDPKEKVAWEIKFPPRGPQKKKKKKPVPLEGTAVPP